MSSSLEKSAIQRASHSIDPWLHLNASEIPWAKHYELTELLGKRVGRRTFLAEDSKTGQKVVIKLLLFGSDFRWEDLKLFEREAETLKTLSHEAIPQYIDFFEVDTVAGRGFALVQTYIEAHSLQTLISSGHRFTEQDLTVIARSLLEILQYLHSRQPPVIHRDIKPSNILLGDHPNDVYLIDFGAVQTTRTDSTMTVVGTYGYMPPEQFGGRARPASDLYSLGTTLVYLASGKHPSELTQGNFQLEFANHVTLSPSLVAWIQQLTYVELSRRIPTATQALSQLGQLTHEGISTQTSADEAVRIECDRAKFRQQAEYTKRNNFQVYTTPTELEIIFPVKHLGKMSRDLYSNKTRNESLTTFVVGTMVLGTILSLFVSLVWAPSVFSIISINVLIWLIGAILISALVTPLHIALDSRKGLASIRLTQTPKGFILFSFTASLSSSSYQKNAVPQFTELSAQRICDVKLKRLSVRFRMSPLLSRLTFEILTGEYYGDRRQCLVASYEQALWISDRIAAWSKVPVPEKRNSWSIELR